MCYTTTVLFDCEHSHTEARPGSLCAGGLLRLQKEEQEQADSNRTGRRDSSSSNGSGTSASTNTSNTSSSHGNSALLATRMSCWDAWPQGHMRREGLCAACTFRLRTYGTPEPSMALLAQALKKAGVKSGANR